MALPENTPSSQPVPAAFIGGAAFPITGQLDYEMGPIAIQDPSKGINYQLWRTRFEHGKVYMRAPNTPEFVYLDLPDITEMSFSFDRNGNPVVVYVQAGSTKQYWYDNSVNEYVTTEWGPYIVTPRLTHDDKRELQSSASDVIFGYVKVLSRNPDGSILDGQLCYRQQRDRYTIERVLATNVTDGMVKVGMMRNLRLGFQLKQAGGAVIQL